MKSQKIILILVVVAFIASFFIFDLGRFLSLEALQQAKGSLSEYYTAHSLFTLTLYFTIYVLATAFSLPGATILTLGGGALFGLATGIVVVSFASTVGATLAFIVSRYLVRDWVQNKFANKLESINKGIEKEGGFYLFSLRLVPVVPFFVINLVMGLTKMPVRSFYWISQVGMLPGTFVYVNAGTQLSELKSLSGILSPALLGSFVLLGVFPLIAKKIISAVRTKRVS